MNNTLLFATSNEDKVREVREMLAPFKIKVLSLKDVGLSVHHPEDAETFAGNSKIKAEDIAKQCSYAILSDDSGLSIDVLGGFPGVHSARFMEGRPYSEKNRALIEMLKDKENRKASYFTVMTFISADRTREVAFEGRNDGEITTTVDDHATGGFGYDPIFYSYDLKKTFGRATPEEKDAVSHRGRAMQKFVAYIEKEGL